MTISRLSQTAEWMSSSDYKDRFKAEYYQLFFRYLKLKNMVEKWDKGELDFKPTCEREIYDSQLKAMEDYRMILGERARKEEIDLNLRICCDCKPEEFNNNSI